MRLFKLKNILAIILIFMLLLTVTGCNYFYRPDGAKNNSMDNSSRLQQLLVKDQFVPSEPDEPEQPEEPTDEPEEPTDEPEEPTDEPEEPSTETGKTPFDAPGDVITKINGILKTLALQTVDPTSATGVKDEFMTSRTVTVYMPQNLFENQDAAIQTIASTLNMNIDVQPLPSADRLRQIVLSGGKADLVYVDQSTWGYTHHITQEISKYVNLKLADELDSFSSLLSSKFAVGSLDAAQTYVASGMSSPYMLVYNKDSLKVPTETKITGDTYSTAEQKASEDYVAEEYKDVTIKDPVTMYNEGTWGVSAFAEILKANTVSGKGGLVSFKNDDRNLDMWFGMQDNAGFSIGTGTRLTAVETSLIDDEGLDTVGAHIDFIQSMYWQQTGADRSNYIASFVDAGHGDSFNNTVWTNTLKKVMGKYAGNDLTTDYTFMAIDLSEYQTVMNMAKQYGVELEVVPLPYGLEAERAIRLSEPDDEGIYDNGNGNLLQPYVASSVAGFSVLKGCENPSVALRVAEEITKAWKTEHEQKIVDTMDDDVQERYESMKKIPGISFFRSIINNAESEYHALYGDTLRERLGSDQRSLYQTLMAYGGVKGTLTQPLYNKNSILGVYNPATYKTWSEFYYGKKSDISDVYVTSNILPILSAAYFPASMLFLGE